MYNYESKLVDSSRLVADMLVQEIGDEVSKFNEMLTLSLKDKYPVSMRAARVIALCAERNPKLIEPFFNQFILPLKILKVDGVKRSFLKILAETSLIYDEESAGILTDIAFSWLEDSRQAISIRYYCIEILLKVSKQYPEIGNELQEMLEDLLKDSSSGIKSKSRKVINFLKKQKTIKRKVQ